MKIRSERNFILSAHAPMINAGVMAANFSFPSKNHYLLKNHSKIRIQPQEKLRNKGQQQHTEKSSRIGHKTLKFMKNLFAKLSRRIASEYLDPNSQSMQKTYRVPIRIGAFHVKTQPLSKGL